MERLTRWNGGWILSHPDNPNGVTTDIQLEQGYQPVLDKLAEYENAEEQGLLVRLPCKVGDKFDLVFDEDDIVQCIVNSFECDEYGDWCVGYKDLIFGDCTEYLSFDEFKAEAKQKEVQDEHH